MMSALTRSTLAAVLILPLATSLVAAEPGSALIGMSTRNARPQVQLAAFGDGPPTGGHHGKRARSGESSKSVAPAQVDMHGATREDADKAYRKKYGF